MYDCVPLQEALDNAPTNRNIEYECIRLVTNKASRTPKPYMQNNAEKKCRLPHLYLNSLVRLCTPPDDIQKIKTGTTNLTKTVYL